MYLLNHSFKETKLSLNSLLLGYFLKNVDGINQKVIDEFKKNTLRFIK